MNEKAQAVTNTDAPTKRTWLSFPAFLVLVVLAALAFRSFAFSLFSIPSESMLPRLVIGDYLIASKWDYGISNASLPFDLPLIPGRFFAEQPERGDVVIFKHPIDGADYVKRVIGLPGDVVELDGGEVVLNGERLPQEKLSDFVVPVSPNTRCAWGAEEERLADGHLQCRYTRLRETLPSGRDYEVLDFGPTPQDSYDPVLVPEGMLFLLGDNRDNSQDSRFPPEAQGGIGLLSQGLLVGRARRVLFSTDGGAEWLKPWTWFTAARGERMGNAL
ncbi:signal peptidase I [Erythrobacter litoralis]|uniref:Signal peptidase I n=1 Tax=Erythrobacter litoralis (strain HTCC2594) TaxID=314225 RepID=Q2NB80_ERYLH|nr:signal peptidase I [Erythrobacter litoralis]ABC63061.1 signal peptidase I [Erythrobacter litoralis HTCC2594]